MSLSSEDFARFVTAVHGYPPFPWQQALLERVVSEGWPAAIDIPTGLGKTSVIDVFVFARALAPLSPHRRLFLVVDRRVVVDEAFGHASEVASALAMPDDGVLQEVASRLRVAAKRPPLEVLRMRGGTTWSWLWADRPDTTAIVTGTVAQLGSRLFFRGYGVGANRRSIDAALVGCDSVVVVDEAHLAGPFITSCREAFDLDASPRPARLVTMSATGVEPRHPVHTISADDEVHPQVQARLAAPKVLHLDLVDTSAGQASRKVPAALASRAEELLRAGSEVVCVVANTVARARATMDLLPSGIDKLLLTGRMREFDRTRLVNRWMPRLRVGRTRGQAPVVLVATQTIEVGVNIDADALVTESASLDAIVQRLGRLNRLGSITAAPAQAWVVHDASTTDEDPIYGSARNATWRWLSDRVGDDGLDVSPGAFRAAFRDLEPEDLWSLTRPEVVTPLMTAERLDCFARTSPQPVPDLPVDAFLYGFREVAAEVTLVWRAGLDADPETALLEADLVPPGPGEGLELPLGAIRRWLGGSDGADAIGDVVGAEADGVQHSGGCIVLRGSQAPAWLPTTAIRPGDTIVVPTDRGGCDEFGWAPGNALSVSDIGDLVERRGRWMLRLGPSLEAHLGDLPPELQSRWAEVLQLIKSPDGVGGEGEDDLRAWAYEASRHVEDPLQEILARVGSGSVSVTRIDPSLGLSTVAVVSAVRGTELGPADLTRAEDDSEDGSSSVGIDVSLIGHQAQVADVVREFADNLGFDPVVIESIVMAAGAHDEGKRDPRFQAMLHGGDRLRADAAPELLAKSLTEPGSRAARRRARERSGYPAGMRHEALSASLVRQQLDETGERIVDEDLVLHLVASHHGRSRPLLPAVLDPRPTDVDAGAGPVSTSSTVDWSAPERFELLNRRYGRWQLALFETVVRLADFEASRAPRHRVEASR